MPLLTRSRQPQAQDHGLCAKQLFAPSYAPGLGVPRRVGPKRLVEDLRVGRGRCMARVGAQSSSQCLCTGSRT